MSHWERGLDGDRGVVLKDSAGQVLSPHTVTSPAVWDSVVVKIEMEGRTAAYFQ